MRNLNRFGTPVTLDIVTNPGASQSVTPVVIGIVQDKLGRVTSRTYANTVMRGMVFDEQFGAVDELYASYDVAGTDIYVQRDEFERDDYGRVVEITDVVSSVGERQCFDYNGHNRLDAAWTQATVGFTADCATFPTLPTNQTEWDASAWANSAGPYATDWTYSKSGRVESISNLNALGATTSTETTATFTYNSDGDAFPLDEGDLPHAVTEISGDGTADDAFTYDAAGRQVTRDVDGVTTALSWDVRSNLVQAVVSDNAAPLVTTTWTYLYDASGQRVAKLAATSDAGTPNQASVYLGETELFDPDISVDGSDESGSRFFTFGGSTVAIISDDTLPASGTGALSYMFGDYQGSAQVMMTGEADPATATVTRNAYTPYGATRAYDTDGDATLDDPLAIERGWLSQIHDNGDVDNATVLPTGLQYLNARYYDLGSARFLSPDPLMDVGDPRTLDPYRYSENNPVSFADPSGLCSTCDWLNLSAEETYTLSKQVDAAYSTSYKRGCVNRDARGRCKAYGDVAGSTPGSRNVGRNAARAAACALGTWQGNSGVCEGSPTPEPDLVHGHPSTYPDPPPPLDWSTCRSDEGCQQWERERNIELMRLDLWSYFYAEEVQLMDFNDQGIPKMVVPIPGRGADERIFANGASIFYDMTYAEKKDLFCTEQCGADIPSGYTNIGAGYSPASAGGNVGGIVDTTGAGPAPPGLIRGEGPDVKSRGCISSSGTMVSRDPEGGVESGFVGSSCAGGGGW